LNIVIKNAHVLLCEPELRTVQCDLQISGGRIAGLGSGGVFRADKVIDGAHKLVMPGLINCHTHIYMSIFRNYADDLNFHKWLFDKIMPVEDRLEPEDAYWCNLLSCLEMIKTGTTCFLDMHMFKGQSVRAAMESGMRAVISRGLVGESADDPAGSGRLAEAWEEMDMARGRDRIGFMLAPHAIYTCGAGYLRHLVEMAKEKDIGLHIHLAESKKEFDDALQAYGCTPTAYLERLGLFAVPTVAAHGVYLTDEDIAILSRNGVHVASNPISNMKLGNGFAPVDKLLRAGVNLCVGTDGASSNNTLNMFKELSALSYIHKGVTGDALSVSARQALTCGTINGAKALGLGGKTGAIAPGMRADLVVIDLNRPQMRPANDLVSALVYSANGSEVETVIIDGQIVLEGGEAKTLDEERIYFEIDRIKNKVL